MGPARAGTTTPFHTGATIATDQANYDGLSPPYGSGVRGIYRAQTTAAGSFAPNAFGLYDVFGLYSQRHPYGVLPLTIPK